MSNQHAPGCPSFRQKYGVCSCGAGKSLFMQKTTPCGRFTVSITSNTPESTPLLVQESARSLKNLSDLLSEGATLAIQAAVRVLEAGKPEETVKT